MKPRKATIRIHLTQVLASTLAAEISKVSNVYRRFLDVHIIEFDVEEHECRQEIFFKIRDRLESLEDLRTKLQVLSEVCSHHVGNVSSKSCVPIEFHNGF